MVYDVWRVRGLFPSLGDGWIHLDPQAGMQIPDTVATTVSTAFRASVSAPSGPYPSARRSAAILDAARAAVADVVGADPAGVVLGPNRSMLLSVLAESMHRRLGIGTEVVLSRLDEESNVSPWVRAADLYGAQVQWAEVDIETCELPAWQYGDLIGPSTRLVAVTAASATVGVVPDVPAIAKLAHEVGALVVVDAAAVAPYRPLDIDELGADVLVLNSASWGGPTLGALVFRDPHQLDRLRSLSLDPHARGPARLEVGEHQYALLAGLVTSVEYLAGLDESATGSRRERLVKSLAALHTHHEPLLEQLLSALRALPSVMVLGGTEQRVPALSFTVAGVPAVDVVQRLADNGICALSSTRSVNRLLDAIGVTEVGGAVTIGLGHYTTAYEIDQLVRVVASLT
ncbi:cysteine desulfurase-like protein [Rhodococcus sp. D2-41]|uniref:Cysteine desulfurase-like protein n=1 Tax=Speluncibacter jeojiensis TaxID=2710754 RepID=A0A9X4LYX2_9ACTN|nr:cysteine desulfurase-like protein [Rhodococcus sp. D2-41]MDG3010409.1 cysteine desulfurase-like protein [Rhodococcus sp. D2-41]MDG3014156.1 cysteine desulfurase-like protein [Corynebacteriales bacterium D3-21]